MNPEAMPLSGFQRQLPRPMAFSGGVLQPAPVPLSEQEQASIPPMDTARLAEFSQGRWHARQALAQLGRVQASLPMGADRAPIWPQGFVGSISHVPADLQRRQPGQVLAVVAHTRDSSGLGVDLERTGGLKPEHWMAFTTDSELSWLSSQPFALRDALAHGLWSAKEAVMKALRQPLDPQDIEIRLLHEGRAFVAECVGATAHRGGNATAAASGRLCYEPGWVAALATLPPIPD